MLYTIHNPMQFIIELSLPQNLSLRQICVGVDEEDKYARVPLRTDRTVVSKSFMYSVKKPNMIY
jgi:hypothetical protein